MKNKIEKKNGDFDVIPEGEPVIAIGKADFKIQSSVIAMGHDAEATEDEQIVFAAGKDNQLRFNKNGQISHNGTILGSSLEVRKVLEDIFNGIKKRRDEFKNQS